MIRVGSGVGETEPAGAADGAPAGGSAVAEAEDAAEEEAIEIDEEEAIGPIRLERLSDAAAQENGGGDQDRKLSSEMILITFLNLL